MNSPIFILLAFTLALSIDAGFIPEFDPVKHIDGQPQSKSHDDLSTLMSVLKPVFHDYKLKFNKIYKSPLEENMRFLNFISSFIRVERHNELERQGLETFKRGINTFSDWSEEELDEFNGFVMPPNVTTGSMFLSSQVKIDLPESVDWREEGAVTEVKHQRDCGSCYSFSATGALEGQIWRKTGKLISLSEQQIVDCDMEDDSCQGGFPASVFRYIKEAGGIETEEDYPYVSRYMTEPRRECKFDKSKVVATDTGYVRLPYGDEEKLREAVATIGPISIGISGTRTLSDYEGGILHDKICDEIKPNHAVLVVGYGTDESTNEPYWLIKNSWGPNWGENGYFRMKRNVNHCHIGDYSVYPLV